MDATARILELAERLEWALDLIDLYDRRLVSIDGQDAVYTEGHVKAKEEARRLLEQYKHKRPIERY
jgi:hypothetical protein